MKSLRTRRILSNVLIYFILSLMAIIWLLPIVWLVLQAFAADGLAARARIIPNNFTFNNFIYLFSNFTGVTAPGTADRIKFTGQFFNWFRRTLEISILVTIISTLFVLGTAYALSRFRFKGRTAFMKLNLVIGMFPGFLTMIMLYWFFKEITKFNGTSLQGNYWTLVIIYSVGAGGGYYISKGFFDTISKTIDEAAMIDGASRARIFFSIILPLAKPIVIYTVLTAFMGPWGEYLTSSYIVGDNAIDNYTVAMGLYKMLQDNDTVNLYYTQYAAGSVVISLPIAGLFLWLQKYYVSGITGGAVKG